MQEKTCFQIGLVREVVQNPNPKVNMDSVNGELTDGELTDGIGLELCGQTVETSRTMNFWVNI